MNVYIILITIADNSNLQLYFLFVLVDSTMLIDKWVWGSSFHSYSKGSQSSNVTIFVCSGGDEVVAWAAAFPTPRMQFSIWLIAS